MGNLIVFSIFMLELPETLYILIDAGGYVNPVLRTSKNLLMTPLDCAMQRGFRSTAKFLQLHGGLPASRLTNLRLGPDISTNVSLSSSLHVREDVTVLGGSSTESDAEDRKETRPKRRSIRRRVAYRYSKTKDSKSDEDTQTRAKVRVANRDKSIGKSDKVSDHENEPKVDEETLRDDFKSDKEDKKIATPSSEEDINKSGTKKKDTEVKSPPNEKSTEKTVRQRPKSAKKRDLKKKPSNEVSEPLIVEGNVSLEKEHENGHINDVEKDQSFKNKSDDEQSKTLVVEASIHEPPKQSENNETATESPKDTQEPKNDKPEMSKTETSGKKVEEKTEPQEPTKETKTTKTKVEDTSITTTVEISETCKENKELMIDKEIIIEQKITIGSPRHKEKPAHKDKAVITIDETVNLKQEKLVPDQIEIKDKIEIGEAIVSTSEPKKEIANYESVEKSEDTKTEDTVIEKEIATSPKSPTVTKAETKTDEAKKQEVIDNDIAKENEGTKSSEKLAGEKTPDLPNDDQRLDESKTKTNEINIDLSLKKFEESAELTDSTTPDTKTHVQKQKRYKKRLKTIKDETSELPEKGFSPTSDHSSSETDSVRLKRTNEPKDHKSFQVIDEEASFHILDEDTPTSKEPTRTKRRSKLLEPTPDTLVIRSRSVSREANRIQSSCETHISLPLLPEKTRSESNLSAPHLSSMYSDIEQKTDSDELDDVISSGNRKKRLKRRSKARLGSKSAGSDYESSVMIDSGFEPSPRSSRIPKRKVMSERGVNMNSVTQSIQTNIRRYHMERKIFQHLLDLKRLQIRSGQTNEAVLVKRAIEAYNSSIASTVGGGRYSKKDFSYRSFEQFLYHSLRVLQKGTSDKAKALPDGTDNPLLCTQSTHRCMHATHAYTGIPCAAYIPKLNHHTMPKIGFSTPKTQASFLPQINNKGKAVTLELCHGNDKQVISLPADRLDQNKRYYVTFTVKGQESQLPSEQVSATHRHAKSV